MTSLISQRNSRSREPRPSLLPATLLPITPLNPSIQAYHVRRILSRSRQQSERPTPFPNRPKLQASDLGDVFEAADQLFRNSIAFRHPSELTLPPRRREYHSLWRKSLLQEDYEQAKTERVRNAHYASNYSMDKGRSGEWYRGRPL